MEITLTRFRQRLKGRQYDFLVHSFVFLLIHTTIAKKNWSLERDFPSNYPVVDRIDLPVIKGKLWLYRLLYPGNEDAFLVLPVLCNYSSEGT
jgi:hypothetical protein